VAEHIAAVEAAERTAAAGIAVEPAVAHIAAAVVAEAAVAAERTAVAEGPAAVARRVRAVGRRSLFRIGAEVVATEVPVAEVALWLLKPQSPSPVRRKKDNQSSKGEHRVRIADISS
jgi:hypothetical protein